MTTPPLPSTEPPATDLESSEPLSTTEAHEAREALWKLADQHLAEEGKLPEAPTELLAARTALLEQIVGKEACERVGVGRLPDDFLLSVVIPVYNEAKTVESVIERVRAIGLPLEIVIVDDGSTDGTRHVLETLGDQDGLRIVLHEKNRGKGAAIRTGFAHVEGTVVVIQDADMEYDPRDFYLLLQPLLADEADVVYGSRFSRGLASPRWHQTGNQFITKLSNFATGLKLTDVETCYKMFRRETLDELLPKLGEEGFGIELEMTAKLARMKTVRFHELPISYQKRTYAEGKKIGIRDGFWALWCIMRY